MNFSTSRLVLLTLLALLPCSMRGADPGALGDFFTPDQQPGEGKLAYKQAAKTEDIDFGALGGHYGMGVVFDGSELPAPYRKEFKNSRIIQIVFGTLKTKLASQVPQFGAATLIVSEIPKSRTKYKLVVPKGREVSIAGTALLLFTSPSASADQSDEEKLKDTFFAQSGTLTATTVGISTRLTVRAQGKSLRFRRQNLRLTIDASLVTPFNTQETSLSGTLEFPIYWPIDKDAKALTARIATESFRTAPSLPAPEGLTTHKRDVAGSTKKDAVDAREQAGKDQE